MPKTLNQRLGLFKGILKLGSATFAISYMNGSTIHR